MLRSLFLFALTVLFALPAQAEKRPFRLAGGQVVFDVTLKGRTIPALLDTGATLSLIELELSKELGIRSQKVRSGSTVGVGGSGISYGRTQDISLDLGAGPIRRSVGTYPAGLGFADEDVRMVVGMDFLSDLVVSLDFQAMTVSFERSTAFVAPDTPPLKLTATGWRRSTLPVDLAGVKAELLLDTAASVALHLDTAFVAKTPELNSLPVSQQVINGVDGAREHDAVVIPRVVLGGRVFEDVEASAGSLAALRAADNMDGVVGVALLKNFDVVIDFGHGRVWLTPHGGGSH